MTPNGIAGTILSTTAGGGFAAKLADGSSMSSAGVVNNTMTVTYVAANGTTTIQSITQNSDGSAIYTDSSGNQLALKATDITARRNAQQVPCGCGNDVMGGSSDGVLFFGSAFAVAALALAAIGLGPAGLIVAGVGAAVETAAYLSGHK